MIRKIKLVISKFAGIDSGILKNLLEKEGFQSVKKNYDAVIILGGDGTFIDNSIQYLGIPILPIKAPRSSSMSSVSYIPRYTLGELRSVLRSIKDSRYEIEKEPVLALLYKNKRYFTVGDFFVERYMIKQAARYELSIKDKSNAFKIIGISNGFIITTPIGSTGYYSYIESLNGKPKSRINGMGLAHILPSKILCIKNGKVCKPQIRMVFSLDAKITARMFRNPNQRLYGIPNNMHGIEIAPDTQMRFSIVKDKLLLISALQKW
ncbi:MAG: hypothetical protein ACP5RP_04080 [Candidatus Micrarchaeia archaeon]